MPENESKIAFKAEAPPMRLATENVDQRFLADSWFLSVAPGMQSVPELQPGTMLADRFRLDRLLGRGATSSVYLARDSVRNEPIALKIRDLGPWHPEAVAETTANEVSSCRELSDFTYVVRVHDVHLARYEGAQLLLISMEYADGGSLRDWLVQRRSDLQARWTIGPRLFIDACRGVQAIHATGRLHLDLKPENLLCFGERLKVADLGGSTRAGTSPSNQGTPAYRAPEAITSSRTEATAPTMDVYSLGCILFETLDRECRRWQQVGEANDPLERELRGLQDVPVEPFRAVIRRCLHRRPEERYPDVSVLLEEVQAIFDPQTGPREPAPALWRLAGRSFCQGHFTEAREHCTHLLTTHPDHGPGKALRDLLHQRQTHAQQMMMRGEQEWVALSLNERLDFVENALTHCPDHPTTQQRLAVVVQQARQYRTALEQGLAHFRHGNLETAQLYFESASRIDPNAVDSQLPLHRTARFRAYITRTQEQIEAALEREDWRRVYRLATCLLRQAEALRCGQSPIATGDQA
jgi:tetratricopeptide (TPR) repeat protein/tRNA A-37 threonylcarbamoyl transferase component Bud32